MSMKKIVAGAVLALLLLVGLIILSSMKVSEMRAAEKFEAERFCGHYPEFCRGKAKPSAPITVTKRLVKCEEAWCGGTVLV